MNSWLAKLLGIKIAHAPAPKRVVVAGMKSDGDYVSPPENFTTNITSNTPTSSKNSGGPINKNLTNPKKGTSTQPTNSVSSQGILEPNSEFTRYLVSTAKKAGYNPTLLAALIATESSGNPKARNGNAYGLTQITPIMMKQLGLPTTQASLESNYDPITSLKHTILALDDIKRRYPDAFSSPESVYTAWNTGSPTGVTEENALPNFKRNYALYRSVYR